MAQRYWPYQSAFNLKSLAIIVTHPIQYYAPMFKQLALYCHLKVFYTLGLEGAGAKFDVGFGKTIDWDILLLDAYEYEFLNNTANTPSSDHFFGIINTEIIQRVAEHKPDAILVYGWAYQSHLKAIRYFKGKIPVWFRGDSTLLDTKANWKKLFRKTFLTWVYRNIDKAIYVGKANKAYYKAYGLTEDKLVFVPHAIDNKRFSSDHSTEAMHLRKSLNINQEEILILFAGKFEQKKSPELLLKAFLNIDIADAHLLFVGNGHLENDLKNLVEQKSKYRADHIHFINFQNQSLMPSIYQACDLFCLPSQGPAETWGLAVNEAMATGKAILVSNRVGCAEDLVKEAINGAIFKSGNMSDLTKKLLGLIANKTKLLEMGKESKKIIQEWSFEIQVKQILTLLNARN